MVALVTTLVVARLLDPASKLTTARLVFAGARSRVHGE
jgi:hypothetical protein